MQVISNLILDDEIMGESILELSFSDDNLAMISQVEE